MKWQKKKYELHTIEEVVTANTGLSADKLLNPKKDPYIKNLKEAADMTRECIRKNVKIHIVGDYDCDGVMSTTELYLGLKEAGADPSVRFPRRFSEGYGLSMKIIDEIDDGLIITIDNGIAAVEQVAAAKAKGIQVIILDHHLRRDDNRLPDADIIVDPNAIDGSEYKYYCAAGLAYRFVKELVPQSRLLDPILAMAGIATVADVMELVGDNRNLVKESFRLIDNRQVTLGMRVLLDELQIEHVNEGDYGFKLGPIVNASGRLKDDGPLEVFELLKTDYDDIPDFQIDYDGLKEKAVELVKTNRARQEMVKTAMYKVYKMIDEYGLASRKPIVLYDPDFSEGIVGILAGRVAEEFQTPCIVFTDSRNKGILKGSGRTYGNIHLKDSLDRISDVFAGYGGHAGAAGVSVEAKRYHEMIKRWSSTLKKELQSAVPDDPDLFMYDLEGDVQDIKTFLSELDRFAPYGQGNPQISFKITGFECMPRGKDFFRLMGPDKNHIRFYGNGLSAVGFDMAKRYEEDGSPKKMDMIGYLSRNWYMNKSEDQIEIIDYKGMSSQEKTDLFSSLESLLIFQ